ncbi:hypothetical protein NDU88_012916, partial [Pleurodeles waltl]
GHRREWCIQRERWTQERVMDTEGEEDTGESDGYRGRGRERGTGGHRREWWIQRERRTQEGVVYTGERWTRESGGYRERGGFRREWWIQRE